MNGLDSGRLDVLVAPLSGAAPSGKSVRLDTSFEQLDSLVKQSESLSQNGVVDWRTIERDANLIVSQQSKDLLVFAYWVWAVTKVQGYPGLKVGLDYLKTFLDRFWETMFPEKNRLRARGASLQWLVERLELFLELNEARSEDLESVQSARASISWILPFCRERLHEHSPEWTVLSRLLRQADERLSKENAGDKMLHSVASENAQKPLETRRMSSDVKPESLSHAVSNVQSADTEQGSTLGSQTAMPELSTERGLRDSLRQFQQNCKVLSDALIKQDLGDCRSYEIVRTGTWSAVTSIPDNKDGKTALRSVPKDRLALFSSLASQQKHIDLIHEVERSFASAPFWLDAHFYVYHSLKDLGYTDAAEVVASCYLRFIGRFPEIISYRFSDETPFASDETRQWTGELMKGDASQPAVSATTIAQSQDEALIELKEQLQTLASAKKVSEAIQLFHSLVQSSTNFNTRIYRQYEFAEFCKMQRAHLVAKYQFEDLRNQLTSGNLVEWLPELAANVAQRLLQLESEVLDSTHLQNELFKQLCLLDAAKAYELSQLAKRQS